MEPRSVKLINANNPEELSDKVNAFYAANDHSGIIQVSYHVSPGSCIAFVDYYQRSNPGGSTFDLEKHLEETEKAHLEIALRQAGGDPDKAAKHLGMSLRAFNHKVRKYKI